MIGGFYSYYVMSHIGNVPSHIYNNDVYDKLHTVQNDNYDHESEIVWIDILGMAS